MERAGDDLTYLALAPDTSQDNGSSVEFRRCGGPAIGCGQGGKVKSVDLTMANEGASCEFGGSSAILGLSVARTVLTTSLSCHA